MNEDPSITIRCEDVESLQALIYTLYDNGILNGESSFMLENVPDNILEILNDPMYFEPVSIAGIIVRKGEVKQIEIPTDKLL